MGLLCSVQDDTSGLRIQALRATLDDSGAWPSSNSTSPPGQLPGP